MNLAEQVLAALKAYGVKEIFGSPGTGSERYQAQQDRVTGCYDCIQFRAVNVKTESMLFRYPVNYPLSLSGHRTILKPYSRAITSQETFPDHYGLFVSGMGSVPQWQAATGM